MRSGQCSEQVAPPAVGLYGHTSGAVAVAAWKRLAQIELAETSLWRWVEPWSRPLPADAQVRQASANALPLCGDAGPKVRPSTQNRGGARDGTMIHIRKEGWKAERPHLRELKVGCVFAVAVRSESVPETEEVEDRAPAVHTSYLGVLGTAEALGRVLWTEAVRRRMPPAHDRLVRGDGARWIWDLAPEHFGTSWQVVDWYQAKQHLHQVADVAFGEGAATGPHWVKTMRTPLYQGQVCQVSAGIQELAAEYPSAAKALLTPAGYFETNQRRRQYLEVREAGLPLGSGMVESGCKRFGTRFDGAGMRWSREGAERLIPLRAAILRGRFDDLWKAALTSPPK